MIQIVHKYFLNIKLFSLPTNPAQKLRQIPVSFHIWNF